MQPRRAKKIDANQNEIVRQLRALPGVSVELDHDDILVGYNLMTYWIEIKSDAAVSRKTGEVLESKKKPKQRRLERTWRGHYSVVSSFDQIIEQIGYGDRK